MGSMGNRSCVSPRCRCRALCTAVQINDARATHSTHSTHRLRQNNLRAYKKIREIKEVDDNTFLISLNYLITLTFNLLYQFVDTAKDAISKFA